MTTDQPAPHADRDRSEHPEQPVYGDAVSSLVASARATAKAEAERDEIAGRLSRLLWRLTAGRLSKPTYDVPTMVAEIDSTYDDAQQEERTERDVLRAEVERLRDTNARLNRRAQVAEACINSLVSANPAKGRASNLAREVWEQCMEGHAKAFHRHEAAERADRAESVARGQQVLIEAQRAIIDRVRALADEHEDCGGGYDECAELSAQVRAALDVPPAPEAPGE